MNNQTIDTTLKKLIQHLDLTFISYVGYPADETIPYPEEFARGYHTCIEDLINEIKRIGLATTVPSHQEIGES